MRTKSPPFFGNLRHPGITSALLTALIIGTYIAAYALIREVYIIDNVFLAVEYGPQSRAIYPIIELYRNDDPRNLAHHPQDHRRAPRDFNNIRVLNLRLADRERHPTKGWLLPTLFYPVERFEAGYLLERDRRNYKNF